MPSPKPKYPVTPLPMKPELRAAIYKEAERHGRNLTAHILIVLEENTPGFKARK